MPIKDLARNDPVTASPDASLEELATAMRDEQVGSVVVAEDGKPVGIVTDRDLALRTYATEETTGQTASDGGTPQLETAADVMTPDPFCVDCEAGVAELTEAMSENGVRRIPVTEDDELTGIITLDDLSRLLSDEQANLASVIEAESPAY